MKYIVTPNGKFIGRPKCWTVSEHNIYITAEHGTCTASSSSAYSGSIITLTSVGDPGYVIDHYEITGATMINDNQFIMGLTDVYVTAHFAQAEPGLIVGNLLWSNEYLDIDDGEPGVVTVTEFDGAGPYSPKKFYSYAAATRIANAIGSGWRVPTYNDGTVLMNYGDSVGWEKLRSDNGWYRWSWGEYRNGTNELGFNLECLGYYSKLHTDRNPTIYGGYSYIPLSGGRQLEIDSTNGCSRLYMGWTNNADSGSKPDGTLYPVRLVKDLT